MTHELSRDTAVKLQDGIQESLTERNEFLRTAGVHREDGKYVVERRNSDSAGNTSVFEDFDEIRRLYARLPDSFDAESVAKFGITGSRRHMIVRHLVEHPAFDCELESRNPLRGQKTPADEKNPASAPASAD